MTKRKYSSVTETQMRATCFAEQTGFVRMLNERGPRTAWWHFVHIDGNRTFCDRLLTTDNATPLWPNVVVKAPAICRTCVSTSVMVLGPTSFLSTRPGPRGGRVELAAWLNAELADVNRKMARSLEVNA